MRAIEKDGYWIDEHGLETRLAVKPWLCRCCGKGTVDSRLITKAALMETITQHKMEVLSGCRCEEHNKDIGGSEYSAHLFFRRKSAKGFDGRIKCHPTVVFRAALIAGFSGIGLYVGARGPFLHMDLKTNRKTNPRFWFRDRKGLYHYFAKEMDVITRYMTEWAGDLDYA